MKFFKLFFKLTFLFLLLFIITIYFFGNYFLNKNFTKNQIINLVNSNSEFKLKLNGVLNLELYPNLKIKLNDFSITGDNLEIKASKFFTSIPFQDLIKGNFLVSDLKINNLSIIDNSLIANKKEKAKIKNQDSTLNIPHIEKITLNNFNYNQNNEKIFNASLIEVLDIKNSVEKNFSVNNIKINNLIINDNSVKETKEEKAKLKNQDNQDSTLNIPNISKITLNNFKYNQDNEKILDASIIQALNIRNSGTTELISNFTYAFRDIKLKANTENLKQLLIGNKSDLNFEIKENNKSIEASGNLILSKNYFNYSFKGEAFNGFFDGKIDVNEGIVFKLNSKDLDTQVIEDEFKLTKVLEGLLNISLDLENKDFKNNIKDISGQILINSNNLIINNNKLKLATSSLYKILEPVLRAKKRDSECTLFNFELINGKLVSKEQVMKLGNVFIFPKGSINFNTNKINYNFHVNSSKPALASLIPPFKATGKLNNISFIPSVSATVGSVFDSAQGVVGSATKILKDVKNIMTLNTNEKLSGIALCEDAYRKEQRLLSSQVGKIFD